MARYTLKNTQISIEVDTLGAELKSLKKNNNRNGIYVGCKARILEADLTCTVSHSRQFK